MIATDQIIESIFVVNLQSGNWFVFNSSDSACIHGHTAKDAIQ